MKSSPAWRTVLVGGAIAIVAASIVVFPPKKSSSTVVTTGSSVAGQTARRGSSAGRNGVPGAPVPGQPGANPVAAAECAAGRNGGATDAGVTSSTIKLGATVVDSGVGASFLRDARYGMIAVKDAINRAGGICGRKLSLVLKDDGWDPQAGSNDIKSLVEDDSVFALAVVPSSEGLKIASDSGYLDRKGVPVVGSDGMLIHQYRDPMIWPVAASTISTMHIMARQAIASGAKNIGIVYEHTYHFGLEGAEAFDAEVKRLTGHHIDGYSPPLKDPKCQKRFCGIAARDSSYGSPIQTFNDACLNPRCDFIALLLEPSTALNWLASGALSPADVQMGGPQPLFTRAFAQECGAKCHGLWLWTGFDPPIGGNLGKPAIAKYLNDVSSASSSADTTNTFVEGAYVGMTMLVKALEQVGPDLTRANLIGVLNNFSFDPGLSKPLSWAAGDHFANTRMQAWSIQYKDRFSGWRDERVSLSDSTPNADIP